MLFNQDESYFTKITQGMGCIPVFWKTISKPWKRESKLSFCKTLEKYKKYDHMYYGLNLTSDIFKVLKVSLAQGEPPCSEMSVIYDVSTHYHVENEHEYEYGDGDLAIRTIYRTKKYEEIINKRKFDWESLFGQVGGFIGIMLGWSMLNIPVFLSVMSAALRKVFSENEVRTADLESRKTKSESR
jgi:hypothetical protein